MTFKKAEMAKTLKNGLIMIEMNPLNHNWSHLVILSGLTLHQFQKKLLLGRRQFVGGGGVKNWSNLSTNSNLKLPTEGVGVKKSNNLPTS